MPAYTITETWPPGYEEALMRNVSFPGNTVIEVGELGTADQDQDTEELEDEEPDPDTDTDKDVNTDTEKDVDTDNSNNENIHTVRETVPALLSTMDTIDSNDDDEIEITDLQTVETPALATLLCPPPVSSSLVCLQQYHRARADRRSSRVSLRHQTM